MDANSETLILLAILLKRKKKQKKKKCPVLTKVLLIRLLSVLIYWYSVRKYTNCTSKSYLNQLRVCVLTDEKVIVWGCIHGGRIGYILLLPCRQEYGPLNTEGAVGVMSRVANLEVSG